MKQVIPFALAILAIVAACDANNSSGPQVGTVKGTVLDLYNSTETSPLVGVRVVVYPYQGDSSVLHTSSSGAWQITNVVIGPGTVHIESLPPDCDTIGTASIQYFLASPGTTASLTLKVACATKHEVVAGSGDFDGGAINEVRRNGSAARRVGGKYRLHRVADTPRRVGHVILDGRAIALARIAPVPLRHERLL